MRSMIGSASPWRLPVTSSPPHSWSWRLKSPAKITSVLFPVLLRKPVIALCSCTIAVRRAFSLFPSTYTDTTRTSRSGSRIIAPVRSAEGIGTCSASRSLRIQSMLRIGHRISCFFVGINLVQFLWLFGAVTTAPSMFNTYGSATASTA